MLRLSPKELTEIIISGNVVFLYPHRRYEVVKVRKGRALIKVEDRVYSWMLIRALTIPKLPEYQPPVPR